MSPKRKQVNTNVCVKQEPPPPRIWPPPMDQSYCADHFLDECEAYYSAQRIRFEELKAAIQNTYPARRSAGEKSTEKSKAGGDEKEEPTSAAAEAEISKLKEHRKRLGLHRSLRTFKGEIGGMIWDCARERGANEEARGELGSLLHGMHLKRCPFLPRTGETVICRYCDFEDRMPRLVAPVAPMDSIPKTTFTSKQCGSVYGISFAVDVCSGREIITLRNMIWLDSLYRLVEGKYPKRDEDIPRRKQSIDKLKKPTESGNARILGQNRAEAPAKNGIKKSDDDAVVPRKRKIIKPPLDGESPSRQKLVETTTRNTLLPGKTSKPRGAKPVTTKENEKIRKETSDKEANIRKRRKVAPHTDSKG